MPDYCEFEDIKARAPSLKPGENVDTDAQVEEGIRDAMSVIDGRLCALYSVPFPNPIPGQVRSIAAYLAAAFLLDSGWSSTSEETNLGEHYRGLAEERLDLILSGKLQLYPAADEAVGVDFYAHHSGREPVLGSYDPYSV